MRFVYYLLAIPFVALLIWLIYIAEATGEGISFAPWNQESINTQLILAVCLLIGYFFGRFSAWFAYIPLRGELRRQKKANKTLNQEQAKLNKTVDGLKQDIVGLQEKAKKETATDGKMNKFKSLFKLKRKSAEK